MGQRARGWRSPARGPSDPKPFSEGGAPVKLLPSSEWTGAIRATVALYKRLAQVMVRRSIEVRIAVEPDVWWAACYGPCGVMHLNKGRLGAAFFAEGASERVLDLLIHELGHEYCADHLSKDYYRALTKLGARLALAVAADPGLLAHDPDAPPGR